VCSTFREDWRPQSVVDDVKLLPLAANRTSPTSSIITSDAAWEGQWNDIVGWIGRWLSLHRHLREGFALTPPRDHKLH